MDDPYVEYIREHWLHITELYNQYADKRPIMLADVQQSEIHAFPYEEFANLLDAQSQATLAEQYERAKENRQMVLFVRDTANKLFQSYSLALEDTPPPSIQVGG
jgi:hypothetical protein